MPADEEDAPVLVTGGSGYLAGFVIAHLLTAGRTVRTTIRDLARADTVRAVLERHAPTGRLSFHTADLLADAGWDAATEGAGQVIHVASPMPVREYRRQDLERPAREGVRRVLEAARRAGVRRVVTTSSTVAAIPPASGAAPVDGSAWTDLSGGDVTSYARSKTLAEQDAWAIAAASGDALALTTVLPGFDVREAAELHVKALSDPRAQGRRLIAASYPLWFREIAAALKAGLGGGAAKVSTREAPDWLIRAVGVVNPDARFLATELGRHRTYDPSEAQAVLGRPLSPLREAVIAAGRSLLELGLA